MLSAVVEAISAHRSADLKRGDSMTNPSGLQSQSFVPNPMPDVIDSLKRLERIGSGNSKTTEKLIQAARDVENKIVEAFAASRHQTICVLGMRTMVGGLVTHRPAYEISDLRLKRSSYEEYSVSEDRESALEFSKAIAEGLLDEINDALQKRTVENENASAILSEALLKV